MRAAIYYTPLWLPIVLNGAIVLALLRQAVEIKGLLEHVSVDRVGMAGVGKAARAFVESDLHSGRRLSLETFSGQKGVLLFVSSRCGHCTSLVEQLPSLGPLLSSVIVICGEETTRNALVTDNSIQYIYGRGPALAEKYEITQYPTAVVIDETSTIVERGTPKTSADIGVMLGITTEHVNDSLWTSGVANPVRPQ